MNKCNVQQYKASQFNVMVECKVKQGKEKTSQYNLTNVHLSKSLCKAEQVVL